MGNEYMNKEVILSVKNLRINFRAYGGLVQAVRGIDFDLHRGETAGDSRRVRFGQVRQHQGHYGYIGEQRHNRIRRDSL